jgi:FixJ family two-component response regulator
MYVGRGRMLDVCYDGREDPSTAAMAKSPTLLVGVVEDDAGVREATVSLLQSAGFAARGFATAEQFLRSRSRAQVGCLILDVALPGMSGLALQESLRVKGLEVPVIVVTGLQDRAGQVRALALEGGAVGCLRKPFSDQELLSVVKRALARRRAR